MKELSAFFIEAIMDGVGRVSDRGSSELFPSRGVGEVVIAGIFCYTVPCCDIEAIVCEDIDGYKSRFVVDPINFNLIFGTTTFGSRFVTEDFVVFVVVGFFWFLILSYLWNV